MRADVALSHDAMIAEIDRRLVAASFKHGVSMEELDNVRRRIRTTANDHVLEDIILNMDIDTIVRGGGE